MIPTIKICKSTNLIGKNLVFTYTDYRISELWSSFMPRRKEIQNVIGTELYNIQINPVGFSFEPNEPFVKWAAVPVENFDFIPEGMEALSIPEGLYAVFMYQGIPANAEPFYRYIYTEWLPNSGYELDNRPHFEILGDKYKHNDPTSEEEIWIPIKKKV